MHIVAERTYKWMQLVYEREVQSFLDDPDEQFTSWTYADFLDYYETLLTVGLNCGTDFWTVANKEGTEYEIDRFKTMLKEAGHPEYASYEPQTDQ